MLVKLSDAEGVIYRSWLAYFTQLQGTTTFVERTEAFFAARRGEFPPLFNC